MERWMDCSSHPHPYVPLVIFKWGLQTNSDYFGTQIEPTGVSKLVQGRSGQKNENSRSNADKHLLGKVLLGYSGIGECQMANITLYDLLKYAQRCPKVSKSVKNSSKLPKSV